MDGVAEVPNRWVAEPGRLGHDTGLLGGPHLPAERLLARPEAVLGRVGRHVEDRDPGGAERRAQWTRTAECQVQGLLQDLSGRIQSLTEGSLVQAAPRPSAGHRKRENSDALPFSGMNSGLSSRA